MEKELRRRQSFVDIRRKSLTFNDFVQEIEEPNDEKSQETFRSVYQSLLKEKEDWKEILKEKKLSYKSTVERLELETIEIKREDVEKYITPEDKELIDNKPNYKDMICSMTKYANSLKFVEKYKSDMINYYDKACVEIQFNQKLLVDEMCAENLCDVCNQTNCEVEDHKFTF